MKEPDAVELLEAEVEFLKLEIKALEDGTGLTNVQEQFEAQLKVEHAAGRAEERADWTSRLLGDGRCVEKLELVRDVLNPSTGATDNKTALAECYLIVRSIVDPLLQERALDESGEET